MNFISKLIETQEIDLIHGHSPAKLSKYNVAKDKNIPFTYNQKEI